MQPIDRFSGDVNAELLTEAFRNQYLVHGDSALAVELSRTAKLVQLSAGARVIEQGDSDNDLYCILIGEVSIIINGQEIARRHARQHIGEMALIDPGAHRS